MEPDLDLTGLDTWPEPSAPVWDPVARAWAITDNQDGETLILGHVDNLGHALTLSGLRISVR